jgi:hypothetical protein
MKMKLLPVAVALLALLVVASCRDLAAVPAAAQGNSTGPITLSHHAPLSLVLAAGELTAPVLFSSCFVFRRTAADGAAAAATDDNAQAQIKPTGYVGGACIIVCRYCKLPGGDCFSCDCGH